MSTRSWLIGLPTVIVAAALCISLISPPAPMAAAAGPGVRVPDMLQAFASGNVYGGPGVFASDTAPQTQTIARGLGTTGAYPTLSLANLGSTTIDVHISGGASFVTVAPSETVTMTIPPGGGPLGTDTIELSATDTGTGAETRGVWVLRVAGL